MAKLNNNNSMGMPVGFLKPKRFIVTAMVIIRRINSLFDYSNNQTIKQCKDYKKLA